MIVISIMEEPIALIFRLEESWNKIEMVGLPWNSDAHLLKYMRSHA